MVWLLNKLRLNYFALHFIVNGHGQNIDSNGYKDGERAGRNKEMLCFFDTALQKASPAGSSCLILIIVVE
jgi:hypothetical protein